MLIISTKIKYKNKFLPISVYKNILAQRILELAVVYTKFYHTLTLFKS